MDRRYGPRREQGARPEVGPRETVERTGEGLRAALARLDRGPYPAYKELRGAWDLGAVTLFIDHVQGDPFAAPAPGAPHGVLLSDLNGVNTTDKWQPYVVDDAGGELLRQYPLQETCAARPCYAACLQQSVEFAH